MVKAVIFDLDDTLISEREYINSGFKHVARVVGDRYELDENSVFDDLQSLINTSPLNVFNRMYEKHEIQYSQEMVANLVDEYRGHIPNIRFYADVEPCLSKLRELKIKIGIITDGYAIAQNQKIKSINADKYFDEIIVTDEIGREYWKPHPKAFKLISKKMDVSFNEMIYIGDNPEKDFYVGAIFPIKTIRIMRENSIHLSKPYYKAIKENFRIKSLEEISNYLR